MQTINTPTAKDWIMNRDMQVDNVVSHRKLFFDSANDLIIHLDSCTVIDHLLYLVIDKLRFAGLIEDLKKSNIEVPGGFTSPSYLEIETHLYTVKQIVEGMISMEFHRESVETAEERIYIMDNYPGSKESFTNRIEQGRAAVAKMKEDGKKLDEVIEKTQQKGREIDEAIDAYIKGMENQKS